MVPEQGVCWKQLTTQSLMTLTLNGPLDLDTLQRDDTQLSAVAHDVFSGLTSYLPTPDDCGGEWRCNFGVALASVCSSGESDEAAQCLPKRAVADLNRNPALWPTEKAKIHAIADIQPLQPENKVDVSVWVTQSITTSGVASEQRPLLIPEERLLTVVAAAFGDSTDEFAIALRSGRGAPTFAGMRVATVRSGGHKQDLQIASQDSDGPAAMRPEDFWLVASCGGVLIAIVTVAAAIRRSTRADEYEAVKTQPEKEIPTSFAPSRHVPSNVASERMSASSRSSSESSGEA